MSEMVDPELLREWMFNFTVDHTGEDCSFYNILERPSSRQDEQLPFNGPELDRAELFHELVTGLVDVLGSEEAVGRWLNYSSIFKEFGGAPPMMYLEEGGFWALSLFNDVVKIAHAHPTDPLGFRFEMSGSKRDLAKDLESCLDLIPAAWDMDDDTFEQILGVESGYLQSWRHHEVSVTANVLQQLRQVLIFHEALRLHVRPRGYAAWWRRSWAEGSAIGSRNPIQVWQQEGWDGLNFIKRVFWGQQA
jgi:hypothetical protein